MEVPERERCIGSEGEVDSSLVQLLGVGEAVFVPTLELFERIGMAHEQAGDPGRRSSRSMRYRLRRTLASTNVTRSSSRYNRSPQ